MARDYNCTAEMHAKCVNNAICHLCDGKRLFKDPVAEKKEKLRVREENKRKQKTAMFKEHKAEKKEGMAFEKRVAAQWNKKFGGDKKKKVAKPRFDMQADIPDIGASTIETARIDASKISGILQPLDGSKINKPKRDEAQRQFNSGAFWHSKGDIKLEHALMECKERGTVNARGEKQITIPKDWLTKQEKEAFQEQRPYWYLPFGYKGDDSVYLVKPYDQEMEMIYEMRKLREEVEMLRAREAKQDENS